MKRLRELRNVRADEGGSVATEFALTLPLLIALTVMVIEFMYVMFTYQAGVDAARAGVRIALIGSTVANLSTLSSSTDVVCSATGTSNLASVTCGGTAIVSNTAEYAVFNEVVSVIQARLPTVKASQIQVTYGWPAVSYLDGLGGGGIVTPVVSVDILSFVHDFVVLGAWIGANGVDLPPFTSSRLMHSQVR